MTKEIIENDHYKLSGVDIDAGNDLVEKIKNLKQLFIRSATGEDFYKAL